MGLILKVGACILFILFVEVFAQISTVGSISSENSTSISNSSSSSSSTASSIKPVTLTTAVVQPVTSTATSVSSITPTATSVQPVSSISTLSTTGITSPLPIGTPTSPFWVKTELEIATSVDLSPTTIVFENKTMKAYNIGYQRSQAIVAINSRRKKRSASIPPNTLQIVSIVRNTTNQRQVALIYYVMTNGQFTAPSIVINNMNRLSLTEMSIIMEYPVVSRAAYYNEALQNPARDLKLWIIGAVLGSLCGAVLIVWLVLFVYSRCLIPWRRTRETERDLERAEVEGSPSHLTSVGEEEGDIESEISNNIGNVGSDVALQPQTATTSHVHTSHVHAPPVHAENSSKHPSVTEKSSKKSIEKKEKTIEIDAELFKEMLSARTQIELIHSAGNSKRSKHKHRRSRSSSSSSSSDKSSSSKKSKDKHIKKKKKNKKSKDKKSDDEKHENEDSKANDYVDKSNTNINLNTQLSHDSEGLTTVDDIQKVSDKMVKYLQTSTQNQSPKGSSVEVKPSEDLSNYETIVPKVAFEDKYPVKQIFPRYKESIIIPDTSLSILNIRESEELEKHQKTLDEARLESPSKSKQMRTLSPQTVNTQLPDQTNKSRKEESEENADLQKQQ